jgi:DNA (cytosine-5)-methyltransferase 1
VMPFIAELRGGGSTARSVTDPLATVTGGGNHHGLVTQPGFVTRNNGSRGDGGEHNTAFAEALRTLTTAGHQSIVTWAAQYGYDTGLVRSLAATLPVQTTVAGDALLTGDGVPDIDDCFFRMLEPSEIGRGMAFRDDYRLVGNKRERTRMLGNAVTPCVSEVVGAALVEAITGEVVAA